MAAFKVIALRYRPDFLIEVLPQTLAALEALDYLRTYERFLLTPKGTVRRSRLEADQRYRDWLLQSPAVSESMKQFAAGKQASGQDDTKEIKLISPSASYRLPAN